MWAVLTELLFSFVVLAFLVISCQNVLHIASGSVRSVLSYVHKKLDRELGEDEGVVDEEENVTTRVVRRRLILKGDEAEDMPGEHVSEEQFTDEHGNIVTKKIVRKVVRRGKGAEEEVEGDDALLEGFSEGTLDGGNEPYISYAVLGHDVKPDVVDMKKGAQIVKCVSLRRVQQ